MGLNVRRAAIAGAALATVLVAGCTSSNNGTPSGSGSSNPSTPPSETSQSSTPASTVTTATTAPATSPATTAPNTSAQAAAHPDWCVDGEISVGVIPDPDGGAAGHNDAIVTFTNISPRTCVLYGYPGVDALDSGGHVVAHATRSLTGYMGGSYSGLHNVSLHPGNVASTVVEGDVGSGGPECSAGVSMRVTAPNLFHSAPVSGAPYVCAFLVHPVVAGSTGR